MLDAGGYYTLLAWLPSYFELSLGLNVESSSLLTLIPYLAMTAMTPFVGPVAGRPRVQGLERHKCQEAGAGLSHRASHTVTGTISGFLLCKERLFGVKLG